MRVVPVDKFVKYITPMAEGCPEFVARREVIATVADLCRATGCITAETSFTTIPGIAEYDIPMAEGLHVEMVRHAYCDHMEMRSVRLDELTTAVRRTDWFNQGGAPRFYTFKRTDWIRLMPRPDGEHLIHLDVIVAVDRETKVVPEQFFTEWLDAVVAGALNRIFRIAGQVYSNQQLAERQLLLYQQGVADIHADAVRDFTRTTGRVKFNRIV